MQQHLEILKIDCSKIWLPGKHRVFQQPARLETIFPAPRSPGTITLREDLRPDLHVIYPGIDAAEYEVCIASKRIPPRSRSYFLIGVR
jgi:hypothetical protein